MVGRTLRGVLAVALSFLGLASVSHGQTLANGAEPGAVDPRPLSQLQGQVSTGSRSLDILLDARVSAGQSASAPLGGSGPTNVVPDILRGPEALSKAEQQGFRDALLREAANTAEHEARRQEGEAQFHPERAEPGRRMSNKAEASQSGGSEADAGEARVTNSFVLFLRENRYWILAIAAGMAVMVWFMSPSLDGRRSEARKRTDQQAAPVTPRSHRHKPQSRR